MCYFKHPHAFFYDQTIEVLVSSYIDQQFLQKPVPEYHQLSAREGWYDSNNDTRMDSQSSSVSLKVAILLDKSTLIQQFCRLRRVLIELIEYDIGGNSMYDTRNCRIHYCTLLAIFISIRNRIYCCTSPNYYKMRAGCECFARIVIAHSVSCI